MVTRKSIVDNMPVGSLWGVSMCSHGEEDYRECGSVVIDEHSDYVCYMLTGPDCRYPMNPTRLLGQLNEYRWIGEEFLVRYNAGTRTTYHLINPVEHYLSCCAVSPVEDWQGYHEHLAIA